MDLLYLYFYLTWVLLGCLICMVKRPDWFPLKLFSKTQPHEFPNKEEAKAMTARALKKLNIIAQDFTETDNGWTCAYVYQTGHFIMTYSKQDNSYVNIIFPGIGDYPIDHIDAVRMTVNRANATDTAVRFFYVINEQTNVIVLHTSVQIANTRRLSEFVLNAAQAMQDLFRLRNDFIDSVNDAIKTSEANGVNDVEYSHAASQRIGYLLLEQSLEFSIMEDYDSSRLEASKVAETYVCEWLNAMGFLKGAKLNSLKAVAGDKVQCIGTEDDILKFSLSEVLQGIEGKDSEDPTIVQIRYTPFGNADHAGNADNTDTHAEDSGKAAASDTGGWNDMRCLTLTFSLVKRTEQADYYKMDYMVPADDTLGQTPKDLYNALKQPLCGMTVFAVNKLDEQKIAAEYNYIINDAFDKVEEGKYNELNEEQQMLINLNSPETKYFIYWGHRYMRNQCYLQALLMFRRVWAKYDNKFIISNEADKKLYYDLCYWMGGCLYKLGLYEQAHYYLSHLDGQGVIDYAKMYLKCLRALKDENTPTYITRLINDVNENIDQLKRNGSAVPDTLQSFLRYLHREQVLAYMDIDMYLAAEPLCHTMINNNENMEFALEQLAIVEKKKRDLIDGLHVTRTNENGIPTNFTEGTSSSSADKTPDSDPQPDSND